MADSESIDVVVLCPGQGAQTVGMGRKWSEQSAGARAVFDEADRALGDSLGAPLRRICFDGPAEQLNRTDVCQPAIYTSSVASYRGLIERGLEWTIRATAGLSLGEYTALHLAGVFDFEEGLRLVALRGRLMQEAAERSRGGMVALIGADEAKAEEVCARAADGGVLVCANFNAPGQIVLSGDADACERAVSIASDSGLRASILPVAGAFHSPHMQPAADGLAAALAETHFREPQATVWSNVTAQRHDPRNMELLKERLVQQLICPVRWAQSCQRMAESAGDGHRMEYHELAPGAVLRGLQRRIDRKIEVQSHDEP